MEIRNGRFVSANKDAATREDNDTLGRLANSQKLTETIIPAERRDLCARSVESLSPSLQSVFPPNGDLSLAGPLSHHAQSLSLSLSTRKLLMMTQLVYPEGAAMKAAIWQGERGLEDDMEVRAEYRVLSRFTVEGCPAAQILDTQLAFACKNDNMCDRGFPENLCCDFCNFTRMGFSEGGVTLESSEARANEVIKQRFQDAFKELILVKRDPNEAASLAIQVAKGSLTLEEAVQAATASASPSASASASGANKAEGTTAEAGGKEGACASPSPGVDTQSGGETVETETGVEGASSATPSQSPAAGGPFGGSGVGGSAKKKSACETIADLVLSVEEDDCVMRGAEPTSHADRRITDTLLEQCAEELSNFRLINRLFTLRRSGRPPSPSIDAQGDTVMSAADGGGEGGTEEASSSSSSGPAAAAASSPSPSPSPPPCLSAVMSPLSRVDPDAQEPSDTFPALDFEQLGRFFSQIQQFDEAKGSEWSNKLLQSITSLCEQLLVEADIEAKKKLQAEREKREKEKATSPWNPYRDPDRFTLKPVVMLYYPSQLRMFLIALEHPGLREYENFEMFDKILSCIQKLPPEGRKTLIEWYANIDEAEGVAAPPVPARPRAPFIPESAQTVNERSIGKQSIENLLQALQQLLTIRILENLNEDARQQGYDQFIKEAGPSARAALNVMGILFEANEKRKQKSGRRRPFGIALWEDFRNDAVNASGLLVKHETIRWISEMRGQRDPPGIDLCRFYFVLDPANKAQILKWHATVQQRQESHNAMLASLMGGHRSYPYLYLRVQRTNIVEDTLRQLSRHPTTDLKKQLKIQFEAEEGVDEGGPTKEFFQLLIQELFNADFGMFIYNEDSHLFWFNSNSLEANLQFELIGKVLGLAIYNSVILDVHFPLAVYKKLMGESVGLDDLRELQPDIARSLERLEKTESPKELEDASLTFSVEVERFGVVEEKELVPGGSERAVTLDNVCEYIDLYTDWLLNKSIQPQFKAFQRGFDDVCRGGGFEMFRAEEVELLVCGSTDLDFEGLEKHVSYQDGFTESSQTVRHFWEVVHGLSTEEKKKFLFFLTGSDRVPIKGLKSLQLFISRNGPDSDRLPTAHTCFNHLLLPDYGNKEKLEKFLRIAIENSKGFGLM
uniref:HECT-type E3 ubiquitin transferase n=1 Tax=Chromera velia CCMP2878 TaxID=1169474 RepID=A0A0G4F3Q5_9ALVE|eukprot:Cvel_14964.t1-p1 / transcript=Cvel_14964.t1 / gene=Cvel_14964 / organism=Chromera_velia_CCMP2878 / gene_product=Ubiquitin-protein ligase E3A, putative / transcript_product=Ubiquitin-protein ligase E3A, putative / location=Cvel_scaffold1086:37642-53253(+) / protein_length=1133 / sequence_SO=supercontig / SO=protein_coding / is_pseudo=false